MMKGKEVKRILVVGAVISAVVLGTLGFSRVAKAASYTGIPWLVTLHPDEYDEDADKPATRFAEIRNLGAKYVRTDFDWSWLEPQDDLITKVSLYNKMFDLASQNNLSVYCIVSGHRTPRWAKLLKDKKWNDRISSLIVSGTVTVYEHINYGGASLTFTNESVPDLRKYPLWLRSWNDVISSFKVTGTVYFYEDINYEGARVVFRDLDCPDIRDLKLFCMKFKEFAYDIASRWGDKLDYYQIWNEPNHPLVGIGLSKEDACKVLQAGIDGVKAADPTALTVLNVIAATVNPFDPWEAYLDAYAKGTTIDILGVDIYPWYFPPLTEGWTAVDDAFYYAELYNKKGAAVIETGYSTALVTEQRQEAWIQTKLPKLRERVQDPNINRGVPFYFYGWYELVDANSVSINIEHGFGILWDDLTRKCGFDDLQNQIASS